MISGDKSPRACRNRREFRTVDADFRFQNLSKANQIIVRSVEDGQLYKLSLHDRLIVDDDPRPNQAFEPSQLYFPSTKGVTIFLDDDAAEFWRNDEFLFVVRFKDYALEKLTQNVGSKLDQ